MILKSEKADILDMTVVKFRYRNGDLKRTQGQVRMSSSQRNSKHVISKEFGVS